MTVTSLKAESAAPAEPSRQSPPELAIQAPEGWLSRAEVAALTPEAVVERIRALQPLIAANAAATEQARRPVPEVWNALIATGVFYHFVPKRYGGCEFGVEAFVDAMLPIGEVCPSTCWAATFTVDHNWLGSLFGEELQREFFGDGRFISAPGVSSPMGKARRVADGYRLTGHWKWGSGVMNADWIFGMAMVEGETAPKWFAFPAAEARVLDTWFVDGMAGTGSNDIVAEDVFVPAHRTLEWADALSGQAPGARALDNPMYRISPVPFLSLCTTIPIVGAAKGLVKLHRERMIAGRVRFGGTVRQADKSSAQVRVAHADLLAHSAELNLRDAARTLSRMGEAGTPDDLQRVRVMAQCAHASSLAQQAANLILQGAGASIHALGNPMQRLMRDVNVACSHQLHEFDELAEPYGRMLFGLPPERPPA